MISVFNVEIGTLDKDITSNDDFDELSLKIVTGLKQRSIRDRFSREADSLFLEAKRSMISSNSTIPTWFIIMTIVLGWNEFIAIVRNPMLTILLILFLSISYFIWYTNMTGPVVQIARASASELGNQVGEQIKIRGYDKILDFGGVQAKILEFLTSSETDQGELLEN